MDATGKPVAAPSIVVHVQYGGWTAWEDYHQNRAQGTPEDLKDLPPSAAVAPASASVQVVPNAVVMNPRDVMQFKVVLKGLPANDPVSWKLDGKGGKGKLKIFGGQHRSVHSTRGHRNQNAPPRGLQRPLSGSQRRGLSTDH